MDKNEKSSSPENSDALEDLEDVEGLIVKTSSSKTPIQEVNEETLPLEKTENGKQQPNEDKQEATDPKHQSTEAKLHEIKDKQDAVRDDTLSQRTEDTLDEMSSKDKSDLVSMEEEEVRKEEERRKKMKVLLTGYLELKTKKETERAILNEKKITSQWLYPFRGSYQKEWELEMRKLKLSFQKALDYKKSHIHAIQRERKLVELNHLWADSAHYRISEELFDFMRSRCDKLKREYLEELEETKRYYLEREKEIVDKCARAEQRAEVLALMRKTVRDKTLQKTQETLQNYKHEGEFLKEKEMEMIREKHITYVEMIDRELKTSVSPPEHKMNEIRGIFEKWKGKYEDFLRVSEKNRKELEKLGDELPELETKVAVAKTSLEDIRTRNREEKKMLSDEIARLQKKAKKCELLNPSLRRMISESEKVMVKLRERKTKLDRIVKLKKLCDQIETESDKMYPQSDLFNPSDDTRISDNDCLPLIRELCSEEVEDPNLLKNLHRKLSHVKLQNQFLQHDIDNLRIEGMALRSDMKKYLHLIASGDWQRIPDSRLREFSVMDGPQEGAQIPEQCLQARADDHKVDMNLKLLDKKFGSMNKQILKRTENH